MVFHGNQSLFDITFRRIIKSEHTYQYHILFFVFHIFYFFTIQIFDRYSQNPESLAAEIVIHRNDFCKKCFIYDFSIRTKDIRTADFEYLFRCSLSDHLFSIAFLLIDDG